MFIEKNPNSTMFLVPIDLINLNLDQKDWIRSSENKIPELFCPNGCNIAKILKVIPEGNNVVLIEVVIMINGAKHFITRRNKKAFAFFSSWESFINYDSSWDKSPSIQKKYTIWWERPNIIYRLTHIIQDILIDK